MKAEIQRHCIGGACQEMCLFPCLTPHYHSNPLLAYLGVPAEPPGHLRCELQKLCILLVHDRQKCLLQLAVQRDTQVVEYPTLVKHLVGKQKDKT